MNSLLLLNENLTNGYNTEILNVISFIAVFCSIFVIISKNPIVSVLFLIGLFASVSSYLIILGLSFIGLSYLIVYIGAVSILFLFILMLINIRISEIQNYTSNSIILSTIIAILFTSSFFQLLPYNIAILNNYRTYVNSVLYNISANKSYHFNIEESNNNDLSFITSKMWDGNLIEFSHISSIGNVMYTNYSIWLIIVSYILLLAMVGAIVITIKQKN